jgi:hypothetical protein
MKVAIREMSGTVCVVVDLRFGQDRSTLSDHSSQHASDSSIEGEE